MILESPSTGDSLQQAGSVAVVGEDGWRSAGEPPNTDRLVEIAWEDGSHGNPTLGFYDGIAEIPDSGRRWWWEWSKERGFHQITFGAVLAWRAPAGADELPPTHYVRVPERPPAREAEATTETKTHEDQEIKKDE